MATLTPFSMKDLIPQEECLMVERKKSELFIGVPKEDTLIEKRICITPEAVQTLSTYGHRVLIEKGAGEAANYSDLDYSKAGAELTSDTKKIFSCPVIVKVSPPTLEEVKLMAPYTVVWSTIQLKTLTRQYFETLSKKKISAIGFDFIHDENGTYPAVSALSEIAGTASILIASELMTTTNNGKGLLFGNIAGVVPTEVVILGAGLVAENAARTAIGMGANVRVFDNSIQKLRRLQNNLSQRISTSTIQEKILHKALMRCDVAIGAIRGKNRAPIVVSESMVDNMKNGAVIIDVSIDTGGCFETSELTTHDHPTIIKSGVIHYGVPNITSRYSRTASMALSNIITPLLLEYTDCGDLDGTVNCESVIKSGIYSYKGLVTNRNVAEWFNLDYKDIYLFTF
ncbi:alanine dehydrogenase [Myroides odoratimimus]|uniref:alanine dehydrogenase n=1 Tax=Myroides odoratimimus TaxID=76832 RepID=UPI002578E362|nr:alanine dehydrogenase [Myroides odoratimimus]MDM1496745.1 alanine dehydrogenase [Myroides odoratimimus]MDM1499389.1 alanine dehydrogenase [Myroides odoratimimus]MDM1512682.1 alanine dehydrogenase [Myroides odoratimimus]MDO5856713.1 alanine dehydrogenase [Myroides odoratimimus]